MAIHAGTSFGRYQIQSLLGAGGMGEVYLAEDTTLRRPVALKLLPSSFTANLDRLHRFRREAHAASSLNHPNILTIYEIGAENGYHFIAAEFIDGESLRQRVQRSSLDVREVLEIGVQVASALSAAHTEGIVHRDIKPENIMVRPDGLAKVLDFGLAKLVERETPAIEREAPTEVFMKTDPWMVMGTTSYMSPEQARGASQVDALSDIWSLGVVLYEMVAGRLPFEGETPGDVIAAILKTEPPALTRYAPDVPAELERIVTKALSKDKNARYHLARDVGLDLKSLKKRLEFEAELERTGKAARGGGTGAPVSDQPTLLDTAPFAPAQTGDAKVDTPVIPRGAASVSMGWWRKRGALAVLTALLAAAVFAAYYTYSRYFARADKANISSIAVLPFMNDGSNSETEYLSDGISESLINSLSKLPGVKVIARSSSFKYKGREVDPQEVAIALGVEVVLTGRVAQLGDNLLVSAELVNTRDKTQIWGAQYNRRTGDLLSVQSEISSEIAENLRVRLTAGERQQLAKRETVNPQAYELLLKGRFNWRKGGVENQKKAVDYFNQALVADPLYALAHAELSVAYSNLVSNSVLDPKEFTPRAEVEAREGVRLDEGLAEAHLALANLKLNAWDWATAESEYRRAIELNPNLAEARRWHATYLSIMQRHEQSIAEMERGVGLDPLSLQMRADVGSSLLLARRYDEAIEAVKKTLELDQNFPLAYTYLAYIYLAKRSYWESIAAQQEAIRKGMDSTSSNIYLGAAYARAGDVAKARAILKQLQEGGGYVSQSELAILYLSLGEREQALASLEKAYTAHDLQLQYLGVDPAFDDLRSEPRFTELMRRVGLTP